jgi:hypothetical protein
MERTTMNTAPTLKLTQPAKWCGALRVWLPATTEYFYPSQLDGRSRSTWSKLALRTYGHVVRTHRAGMDVFQLNAEIQRYRKAGRPIPKALLKRLNAEVLRLQKSSTPA